MKQSFEDIIKNAAENYEADYNPSHWAELEQKLNAGEAGKSSKGSFLKGAAALVAVGLTAALIYSGYIKEEVKQPEETVVEQTAPGGIKPGAEVTSEPGAVITETPEHGPKPATVEDSEIIKAAEATAAVINVNAKPAKPDVKEENTAVADNSGEENTTAAPLKAIAFAPVKSSVCEGEEVKFIVTSPADGYTYEWQFMEEAATEGLNPSYAFASPGTYQVVLIASDAAKTTFLRHSETVKVNPKPVVAFTWSDDKNSAINKAVEFNNHSGRAIEWHWDFGDNQTSSEQNPVHTYTANGTFKVALTAKTRQGCSATAANFVTFNDNNPLLAPNSFSPDGDGLNDDFMPEKLLVLDAPFEMSVFDLKGKLVYKTNDKNKRWNGRPDNSGDVYPAGSGFIWMVTLKGSDGKEQRYRGQVNIIK